MKDYHIRYHNKPKSFRKNCNYRESSTIEKGCEMDNFDKIPALDISDYLEKFCTCAILKNRLSQ